MTKPDRPPRSANGGHLGLQITGAVLLVAGIAVGLFFGAVRVISGRWTSWTDDQLSELVDVARVVVTLLGLLGATVLAVIAYHRQQSIVRAHELEVQRTNLDRERDERAVVAGLRDRYTTAVEQLGHDSAAIRLGGVYAMAALADGWAQRDDTTEQQACVDVLCSYLRTPRSALGDEAADREVRQTIVSTITRHLHGDASSSWGGVNLDFTSARFDGGGFYSFAGAVFARGRVSFARAVFAGGRVTFAGADFAASEVAFERAQFTGSEVTFERAQFTGGRVTFDAADFAGGGVSFARAVFTGSDITFYFAKLTGTPLSFFDAKFAGGRVNFDDAKITNSTVRFNEVEFTGGEVTFDMAEITGHGTVVFDPLKFTGGTVTFRGTATDPGAVTGPWPGDDLPHRWSKLG